MRSVLFVMAGSWWLLVSQVSAQINPASGVPVNPSTSRTIAPGSGVPVPRPKSNLAPTVPKDSKAYTPANNPPPLLFAYFVPNDRQPIPGYLERMDRLMQEVQRFYRQGMATNGYGPLTFSLDRDAVGHLKLFMVKARKAMHEYGRNSSGEIRAEVRSALMAQGINPDSRVLVIFQVLLDRQGDKSIEIGPYVGAGNNLSGTAWFYDDDRLDPRQLGSKAPGGYYVDHPVSLGEFNSHYIGGIAHELGHAFGLPHVCGLKTNPKQSLMGYGNHSYGQELRHEGAGTYLHPASAMLLAHCRSFVGDIPQATARADVSIASLQGQYETNTLVIDGAVVSAPPAFGMVAYNQEKGDAGGYDATGWVSRADPQGHFQLRITGMHPGDYRLRLEVVCFSGATRTFPIEYNVNEQGIPDTSKFTMRR
jgi:hypothetical protein